MKHVPCKSDLLADLRRMVVCLVAWLLGWLLVLYIKGARGFYPPSLAKTVLFGRDRFYSAHFNSISNINRTLTSRENFFNRFTYPAFVLKRVFFA